MSLDRAQSVLVAVTRRSDIVLAVLIVAPLLLGLAFSLGTTLRSDLLFQQALRLPGLQVLHDMGLRHAPTVLLVLGLTFLYLFIPNTPVRVASALVGGLSAGMSIWAAAVRKTSGSGLPGMSMPETMAPK